MTPEISQFIALLDQYLIDLREHNTDQGKNILSRMVKLTEEVGELAECIMSSLGDQRPEKLAEYHSEDLESEIADVLIATLLIAKSYNIDISHVMMHKMHKIQAKMERIRSEQKF